MLACLGFVAQHAATGASPLAALGSHLADPFASNFSTVSATLPAARVLLALLLGAAALACACVEGAAGAPCPLAPLSRPPSHAPTPTPLLLLLQNGVSFPFFQ